MDVENFNADIHIVFKYTVQLYFNICVPINGVH